MPHTDPKARREYLIAYREKNREMLREVGRVYREANRDALRERNRESNRAYRERNPERVREMSREKSRAYRERHREMLTVRQRAYYEANSEKMREQARAYRATAAGVATADRAASVARAHFGDRIGSPWTAMELQIIADPSLTIPEMAAIVGRSIGAVNQRRCIERKKGNLQ